MNTLIASAFPAFIEATGGQTVKVEVSIANTSDVIDAYTVKVFGLDPLWVDDPAPLSLFPGDIGTVDLHLQLPSGFPAGMRSITFHACSQNDPNQFALATITVNIAGVPKMTVAVDPVSITSGSRAQFGMVVANKGNAPLSIRPGAVDPEDQSDFEFTPAMLHLLPGEQIAVQTQVKARRPWVGTPKVRVLSFIGTSIDANRRSTGRVEAIGTFVQRPRIGRWLLSLLGLVTAAAVFAAVLSRTFNSVVKEASVSDALVNEALSKGQIPSPKVPLKPARITGTVISPTSGKGVAGVQAELFSAGDGTVPVASAATADDGSFAFGRLGTGVYRIKFSGAGFGELWYPGGRVFTEGADVKVTEGAPVPPLDEIAFGGEPGTVSGKVIATDSPIGAKVSLIRVGLADPTVPALVASVDVSADGSFTLVKVPSPGEYSLIAERPGAATETRAVVLAPGQQLEGIEVNLRPSGGLIVGTVFAEGRPLGGVDISATDGTTTIDTVSLTDVPLGSYALRNLATPGLYTVTVSKTGFQSQTRAVTLGPGIPLAPIDFSLVPNVGTISGTVSGPGGGPLGGVSVHLTGGEIDVVATTVSQGSGLGTYSFDQLPVPGTYTVTFSKPGFVDQVRLAPIDPAAGSPDVTNIDASLGTSLAVITGVVVDVNGVEVPRATLKLTNGATTRTLLSADEPPGAFAFANVIPGSYTLTASLVGAADVVQLVTVHPGDTEQLRLQLGQQASLSGQVRHVDGTPASGFVVKLFLPDQFPRGTSIATAITDANGRYTFVEVAAPADFVVAVYLDSTTTEALDSEQVVSAPGSDVTVGGLIAT